MSPHIEQIRHLVTKYRERPSDEIDFDTADDVINKIHAILETDADIVARAAKFLTFLSSAG